MVNVGVFILRTRIIAPRLGIGNDSFLFQNCSNKHNRLHDLGRFVYEIVISRNDRAFTGHTQVIGFE